MSAGTNEKFCLRWNDFENNISKSFRDLREDKDFFDVTLAFEDNQLQAHKVILSACSSFFRSVLKRNPHQHPLLFLRGVQYDIMQAVLNFMYHGEVNVAHKDLNQFLSVAEDLQIKGLTQNNKHNTKHTVKNISGVVNQESARKYMSTVNQDLVKNESNFSQQNKEKRVETNTAYNLTDTHLTPEENEIPLMEEYKVEHELQNFNDTLQTDPNHFQSTMENQSDSRIGTEEEEIHLMEEENIEYEPPLQQKVYNTLKTKKYPFQKTIENPSGDEEELEEYVNKNSTKQPVTRNMECLLCHKVTAHIGNMKQHFKVHHYNLQYKCETCLKRFRTKVNMEKHKKSNHSNFLRTNQ